MNSKNVEQEVANAERRMSESGITLTQLSEDLSDKLGVANLGEQTFFRDMLPKGLEDLWTKTPGSGVFRRNVSLTVPAQDADGNPTTQEVEGMFLSEVTRARTQTGRTINEAPQGVALLAEREEDASYTAHEKEALGTEISPRIIGAIRGMQPGELQAVTMEEGSRVLFLRSFVPGREEVDVSHILITYAGATQAKPTMTRTKAEAMELINRIKADIDKGSNFEGLARTYSEGDSAEQGGKIDPLARGSQLPAFEQVAFSQQRGQVSTPVETQFGYHLVRTDSAPRTTSDIASYDELTLATDADGAPRSGRGECLATGSGEEHRRNRVHSLHLLFARAHGMEGYAAGWQNFRSATVSLDPVTNIPVVQITFDEEGGKLFQELTKRNIGKRLAIFVEAT